MKKIIKCRPVDEIALEFDNGEEIVLRYSMKDLMHFNDFEGGIEGVLKEKSIPELCAKIVYVGAVENNDNITIDKAVELVSHLTPDVINEILNEFGNSIGTDVGGDESKKLIAQMLMKMN